MPHKTAIQSASVSAKRCSMGQCGHTHRAKVVSTQASCKRSHSNDAEASSQLTCKARRISHGNPNSPERIGNRLTKAVWVKTMRKLNHPLSPATSANSRRMRHARKL
jgi:hypothetical protein